jgi:hypothetical protein
MAPADGRTGQGAVAHHTAPRLRTQPGPHPSPAGRTAERVGDQIVHAGRSAGVEQGDDGIRTLDRHPVHALTTSASTGVFGLFPGTWLPAGASITLAMSTRTSIQQWERE